MKYLFFIYQWFIAAPILLVLSFITAFLTIVGSLLFSKRWWGYYPPKIWSRCWCILFFVRVEVRNRELIDKNKHYIFVANHEGAFDIFSIYGYLNHNFRWMMRKGLTNIPLVGQACRCAGHIMVDHTSSKTLMKTMADAERQLRKGTSVVIFPEGRRTSDGELGTFKHGAFKLALEFQMPVVPVCIEGSYKVMPRSTFNIRPGKIVLTIIEPIDVKDANVNSLTQQCVEAIQNVAHKNSAKK